MPIVRIKKPPINVDANDWVFKRWFQSIFSFANNGVLTPVGGGGSSGTGAIDTLPNVFGRNLIVNGDFSVWQRGTSFTVANSTRTADRISSARQGFAAGSTVTQQLAGLPGFLYCLRHQRTAGNALTNNLYTGYHVETVDISALQGMTVTLSYWLRFGSTPTSSFTVQAISGTGTDQNYIFSGYTGSSVLSTNTIVPNTNWEFYQQTFSIPSTATELAILFTATATGTAGANEYYDITGLQLEIGSVATAFEHLPFGVQLQRCLRYYQKSFPYATTPATSLGVNSGALAYTSTTAGLFNNYTHLKFTPQLRATPTMTYYNPSAANGNWRATVNRLADSGLASTTTVNETAVLVKNPQVAADITQCPIIVHWTADAEI